MTTYFYFLAIKNISIKHNIFNLNKYFTTQPLSHNLWCTFSNFLGALESVEANLVEAEGVQTLVDTSLIAVTDALGSVEKVKDMFFKDDGEDKGFFGKIKSFFGFSLAQLENNPHIVDQAENSKRMLELKQMLLRMEVMPVKDRSHFLATEIMGL